MDNVTFLVYLHFRISGENMNNRNFVSASIILFSILMVLSCATSGAAEGRSAGNANSPETQSVPIADIQGKDWILGEVRINSATVRINRPNNIECFTLRFDGERMGGIAHPNRYFAPYTAGEGNSLSIGLAVATQMAPLFEIDGLREHEYFAYLSKVKSWDIRNGKLELTGSGENGEALVLVYQ
jgi:heat shock protein HslJ